MAPHIPMALLRSTTWLGLAAVPWWIVFCALDLAELSVTTKPEGGGRPNGSVPPHQDGREVAMLCKAEIRRHFLTRDAAHRYLAGRGFLFLPNGWANGRWRASLEQDASGFALTINLRSDEGAGAGSVLRFTPTERDARQQAGNRRQPADHGVAKPASS